MLNKISIYFIFICLLVTVNFASFHSISVGWNLVPISVDKSVSVTLFFQANSYDSTGMIIESNKLISEVYAYRDTQWLRWLENSKENSLTSIQTGGYWIKAKSSGAIRISNNPFAGFAHHLTLPHVTKNNTIRYNDVSRMKQAGATWVREGIYWANFEKSPGVFIFDEIKADLEIYRTQNINVLGLFAYNNHIYSANNNFHFATVNSDTIKDSDSMSEDDSIAFLSQKFGVAFEKALIALPQIEYWEILNECNVHDFFQDGTNQISTYLSYLKVVSPIARQYNKKIVSCGLLLDSSAEPWLDELLLPQNAQYYDVLGIHPYSHQATSKEVFGSRKLSDWMNYFHKKWNDNGFYNKQVWFTEIGWIFDRSPTDTQKTWDWISGLDFIERFHDLFQFSQSNQVDKFFLYSFEDDDWISDTNSSKPFGIQKKSSENRGGNLKLDLKIFR